VRSKKKVKSEKELKDMVLPAANLAPFSTSFHIAPSVVSFNNVALAIYLEDQTFLQKA